MKKRKSFYRDFKCPICGFKTVAPKKRQTKTGHIKHMYCPICKDMSGFEQIDEFTPLNNNEDFE